MSKDYNKINSEKLRNFSEDIKNQFENSRIRGPIHLSGNNEEKLIEIFKEIKDDDWVFSTHRSHYHALLHGIDPEWLKQEIMEGRSITIQNIKHRFVTSAIVGGSLSMALGVALSIKRSGDSGTKVWAFVGDMASAGGIFHEVVQYASKQCLPLRIVIEDNEFSTNTPTKDVWGFGEDKIVAHKYSYDRIYPHQGCGKWVQF